MQLISPYYIVFRNTIAMLCVSHTASCHTATLFVFLRLDTMASLIFFSLIRDDICDGAQKRIQPSVKCESIVHSILFSTVIQF